MVTETIERKINEKLKVSAIPTGGPQELPTEHKEVQNKRLVEDNGVRIRGIEESKNEDPRKRAESDRSEVNAIMSFLNINTQINDCRRLGTYKVNKCRPILIKLANSWDKRILLMSLSKLRNYNKKVYISKELTPQEVQIENKLLKRRLELLQTGNINRNEIKIQNLKRFRKVNNDWVEDWED